MGWVTAGIHNVNSRGGRGGGYLLLKPQHPIIGNRQLISILSKVYGRFILYYILPVVCNVLIQHVYDTYGMEIDLKKNGDVFTCFVKKVNELHELRCNEFNADRFGMFIQFQLST